MGMNPQICTTEIGVKSLRQITLYPLSIASQLRFSRIISDTMLDLASLGSDGSATLDNVAVVELAMEKIEGNIIEILALITDDGVDVTLDELTNDQATNIAEIIWMVNYEGQIKKVKALISKAKEMFLAKK